METVLLNKLKQKAEEATIYLFQLTDDDPYRKVQTAGLPPLDKFMEQFIHSYADGQVNRSFFDVATGSRNAIVNQNDLGQELIEVANNISSDSEKDEFIMAIDNTLNSVKKAQERWFAIYERGMQLLPAIEEKLLTWNDPEKGQAIREKIRNLAVEYLKKHPDATHFEQHLMDRFSYLDMAKRFIDSLKTNPFLFIHNDLSQSIDTPKKIADAANRKAKGNSDESLDWLKKKNLFNPGIDLEQVRNYFLQLAEPNAAKGKKVFLKPKQVDLFLKRAFLKDDTIPVQVPNHSAYPKGIPIRKLFYGFFIYCTYDIQIDKKLTQPKYVRLLTDNIDGFDFGTITSNFARSNRNNHAWKAV